MDKKRKRFISGMLAAIVLLTSTPVYASEATGLNREPYNLYVEDTDEPLEESHILTIPEPQTESEAQAGNIAQTESETQTENVTQTESAAQTESETEALAQTGQESETAVQTEDETQTGSEPQAEGESQTEDESQAESQSETAAEDETKEELAVWPQPPEWLLNSDRLMDVQSLADGEVISDIYGKPIEDMTVSELAEFQTVSTADAVALALAEGDKIPEENLNLTTRIFINGVEYKGGNVEVMKGDNFSYEVNWNPVVKEGDSPYKEGSWFERTLFKVPGLNLYKDMKASLVINGIKVGDWTMTYDKTSGECKYKVVFNHYIQLFRPDSVFAMLKGSGQFDSTLDGGTIEVGQSTGDLTVIERPKPPEIPVIPPGTGWEPQKPPELTNKTYPFGKGEKWNSSGEPGTEPQIDWRVVFLNYLQKKGEEYLKGMALNPTSGYCLIEDTPDSNLEFHSPNEPRFQNGAPFHIELPVIVPGTDRIVNGSVGNGNYDGPGEINAYITGDSFTEIDGSQATTPEQIEAVREKVKNQPMTWTVTTDPHTRQQTLLINIGKLGGTDKSQGITWDMAKGSGEWTGANPTKGIQNQINNFTNKMNAIGNGTDSPIKAMNDRHQRVVEILKQAIELPANKDKHDQLLKDLEAWRANYNAWSTNDKVGYLKPLEDNGGNLIVPLPDTNLLKPFLDIPVDKDEHKLENRKEYQDFLKSYENIQKDQKIYLENRNSYIDSWKKLIEQYEKAKDFYKDGRIYGFTVKCRTTTRNPSANMYKNTASVKFEDSQYNTEDNIKVTFSQSIVGDFGLGSVVLQKADQHYNTGNAESDIKNVEKNKAGLTGAKFKVYCAADDGTFVKDDDHLAHFLDKDSSPNGNAYMYAHTGVQEGGFQPGEVQELQVDGSGKLILDRLSALHPHYIVETEAPKGYYLDSKPIKITVDMNKVNFVMVGNVSRSVKLQKIDAYSQNPVEGAEFALYKGDGTKVTGFEKKSLNGHEVYWQKDGGNAALKTNSKGELCIHGLDAGSYILKEEKAAPGYVLPENPPSYEFTLEEKLPENKDGTQDGIDETYHYLLNNGAAITNEPVTAKLTVTKQDGNDKELLAGAGFTVFRFTGTEEEWQANRDDTTKWEPIDLTKDEKYFNTKDKTGTEILGNVPDKFKKLPTVYTDADGKIAVTDIPLGHYSIAEVKAPDSTYVRDWRSGYFDVAAEDKDKEVSIYTMSNSQEHIVKDNIVFNYQKKAQLMLVKYDAAEEHPDIIGSDKHGDGWIYDGAVVEGGKRLEGAVYKLFLKVGAAGTTNPNPEELKSVDIIGKNNGSEDTCLGVGTTDKDGILKLENMKDKDGKPLGGLNFGKYYLVEVKAPAGYKLDQTPVMFYLTENTFPKNPDENSEPGLVKLASNVKYDYGLKVIKKYVGDDKEVLLSAAKFVLKDKNGTPVKVRLTSEGSYIVDETSENTDLVTNFNGEIWLRGLEGGATYTLTETEAPKGYKKLENPIEVKIPTEPEKLTNDERNKSVLYAECVVENVRLTGTMRLRKMDEETQAVLSGAQFQLYRVIKEPILPQDPDYDADHPDAVRIKEEPVGDAKETDGNGELTFENLAWGDYFVREVKAPDGYALDETKLPFKINESSFHNNGEVIEVFFPRVYNTKDAIGEVTIVKEDKHDKTVKLPGAQFALTKRFVDVQGKEYWLSYGKGTYTTDQDGKILLILPPGEYRLEETKAPDGYILPTNIADRRLEFTIKEGEKSEKLTYTRENVKEEGSLIVRKTVDAYGEKSRDFEFTVTLSDKTINGSYGEMTFKDGVAVFTLKHGESKTAGKLPTGISYTVKETPVKGYTSEVKNNEGTIDGGNHEVNFVNNVERIEVKGSKVWEDSENQDGKRPEKITVRLHADGEEVASAEVSEDDGWKWAFKNLPKYKDGAEIVYTVTEDAVKDYQSEISGSVKDDFVITNRYTPEKTSISVTKAWDDGNNQDGIRPKEITVTLYADGEKTNQTLILSEAGQWTGSFTDLDVYKSGKKIVYTIKEEAVDGYTSVISGDAEKGFTVTNSHTPKVPDKPQKPDVPDKPSGGGETAKTGDDAMIAFSFSVLIAAAMVITLNFAQRRRRKN